MKHLLETCLVVTPLLLTAACGKDKKEAPPAKKAAEEAPTPAPTEKAEEAPTPAAAAAPEGCPSATAVTAFTYNPPGSDPFEIPAESFTFAKAKMSEPGKLQIFVATQDWPAAEMGVLESPIEGDKDAILSLVIRGEEIAGGMELTEKGNLDTQFSTTLYTKGLASGVMTAEPSSIKLLAHDANYTCGEFDLQGMFDGTKTKFVGTFVAPIEK